MRSSPLRRVVAGLGLLALAPIGYQLFRGTVTAAETGIRAGVVLLAVFVLLRLGDVVISLLAGAMDRRAVLERQRAAGPGARE